MDVTRQSQRRRTFAIISHPDAGKTTLTEQFLLAGGAIQQAGAVQSRKADRSTASDWLALEQQRGISVSSAVMRFEHREHVLNLLDTPGHHDFSEDTYRVLSGVDAAVMVIDAARGVEPQTEKLFAVCRQRGTPVITFVNKMDRPVPDTLAILDDLENKLRIDAHPVTWPVMVAGRLEGIVDRRTHALVYDRDGTTDARQHEIWDASADQQSVVEELELLDALGKNFDHDRFQQASATPVYFGSALESIGVRTLLDAIVDQAPPPSARIDVHGDPRPLDAPFSGFVFKVQANLDPRHRDRLAFVRVCSGRFERGTSPTCFRTGRKVTAKYAHQVFGRDRQTVDEAFPGDIIGLVNATDLRIGDTLYDGAPVVFPPAPIFTPEHFTIASPIDRTKIKQFRRGLEQLDQEGVVQVLRHPDLGDQEPLLAAVGLLQFDVATWRMEHEFGAPMRTRSAPYADARGTDDVSAEALRGMRDVSIYRRSDGSPLALFRTSWVAERIAADHPDLQLSRILVR